MKRMTLGTVAELLAGEVVGADPKREVRGAGIDSRRIGKGELFFALSGSRTHGISFVPDALARGAAAAVVDRAMARELYGGNARGVGALIAVEDPARALAVLASKVRAASGSCPAAAVTGSVGKTTSVRYAATLLARIGKTHRPPSSYNNHLGVPLTILNAPQDCRYLVTEIGSNAAGEVHRLASWVRPGVAVVTAVAPVHLKGFGTLEGVELEKLSILDAVAPGGVGWLPRTLADKYAPLLRSLDIELRTFGPGGDLDVRSNRIMGRHHQISYRGEPGVRRIEWESPFPHSPRNLEAALAVGLGFGVSLDELLAGVSQLEPVRLRGQVERHGGVEFVLDCYNANPVSLESAIERLENSPVRGRRVCVVGTMEELGEQEQQWHRQIGGRLASERVDSVYVIGRAGGWYRSGVEQAGGHATEIGDDDDSAVRVASSLEPGDCVLFKASRTDALERFAARVGALLDRRGAPVEG